jgi:predicted component of type VI protein secretion system
MKKPLPPKPAGREIPASPGGKGPPLFIKIEKYREVVNNLHKLKTYSLSLRDALDALADIEKELQHGLSITHKALDRFNSIIASLDAKISRIPPQEVELPDMGEIDSYARELHEQMDKIRSDLKNIQL